jgi:hypothetical protein
MSKSLYDAADERDKGMGGVERVTRIELALSAWEADVLPLNYTRAGRRRSRVRKPRKRPA